MKQALFLMLGYPGSGKSTFAKQLAAELGAVRFNGDEMRSAMFDTVEQIRDTSLNPQVFRAIDYAASATLAAGYSVIYNASHNKLSDRQAGAKLAKQHNAEAVLVWVQTPVAVAKAREAERAARGEALSILPERYEQLASNLTEPVPSEACIVIDGSQDFAQQLAAFKEQFEDIRK